MRFLWVPLLAVVFLSSVATADPTISTPTPGQGVATWSFINSSNYTASGVTVSPGSVRLAVIAGSAGDTTSPQFGQALIADNIDNASQPGDVVLLDTAQQGPPVNLTFVPTLAQLDDNYLWNGLGSNTNYGSATELYVGFSGNPEWYRSILRWPGLPLPANATLVSAQLQLYLEGGTTSDAMDITVHRMTRDWTESGSTWNDYDGSNPWDAFGGGGDFDPAVIASVPAITTVPGWYTWNITPVAQEWWTGVAPNYGILIRQIDDDLRTPLGRKQFHSGDDPNASDRPRLLLTYTTPSSAGTLESRVLGPGLPSTWRRVWWNATLPAGTSVTVQSRTGSTPSVDGSWSPWSAPYAGAGSPVTSPPGGFLQYRARLFTPSSTSPALHDVTVEWEHFAPSGALTTEPFQPADLQGWDRVDLGWSGPRGTDAALAFSQDGGSSWIPATAGAILTGADVGPIALRVSLGTNDTTASPTLLWISLGFARELLPDGPLDLPAVGPYWLLLVPLLVLAAWVLATTLRRNWFRATDAFLIHSDGRLIVRVGGRDSPLPDEHAVSAMFTLVAGFVKDSFRDARGEGGQLKNFQVDELKVTIARGEFLFLALVGRGAPPPELEPHLARFVGDLERDEWAVLYAWDGLRDGLGETERRLSRFLRKGYRSRGSRARRSGSG